MSELRGSATLSVSGEFSGSFLKANAVDNNTGTEWASNGGGANSWIQFDWASSITLREFRWTNRGADGWGLPRLTFSDSSHITFNRNISGGSDLTFVLPHPKTTTSVRISIEPSTPFTTGANPGAKEIYLNDAYTIDPVVDLTNCDQLITYSSYFSSSFYPWYVLDNNTTNEWASNGDGASSYIQFNYSSSVYITSIQLRDRAGAGDRWGTPRFTFDDASTQDGGGAVGQGGYTLYTLATPKTTTSLRISVASGGAGNNRGFAEAIITGLASALVAKINPTGSQMVG